MQLPLLMFTTSLSRRSLSLQSIIPTSPALFYAAGAFPLDKTAQGSFPPGCFPLAVLQLLLDPFQSSLFNAGDLGLADPHLPAHLDLGLAGHKAKGKDFLFPFPQAFDGLAEGDLPQSLSVQLSFTWSII